LCPFEAVARTGHSLRQTRRRLSSRCRAQRCHCLVTAFIRHALAEASDCCLDKVRRGHYLLLTDCSSAHFDCLRPLLNEPNITLPEFHGDSRDKAERLRMRIASRRDSVLAGDVFSHVSAALIHGLDPIVTGTEAVELTRSAYSRTYSDLRLYARELVDADIDPAHS